MSKQANDIKKHITGGVTGTQLERSPAVLATGEHGGLMWATNRYWLTPAVRVNALLDQFNHSTDEPGTYAVNGSVRRTGDGVKPGSLLGQPEDYPTALASVRFGAEQAYVQPGNRGPWQAVYCTADGAMFGLNADDLTWLSDLTGYGPSMGQPAARALGLGESERFGPVMVQGPSPKDSMHPQKVALVAEVIRTITPSSYGTDPGTSKQVYNEAVTEIIGSRVVGMMMAIRLGS
jgi:hypothetical protein